MAEAQQAVGAPRNATLDGLKYVAAGGIVLHHTAAYSRAAGSTLGAFLVAVPVAALFFFFAVSGYFHGEVGGRGWPWLGKRILRLGAPYVIWSVFYLLWAQRHVLKGGAPFIPPAWTVAFFAGAHGILWSLPMLVYCAVVIEVFVRTATQRRIAFGIAVAAALAIYWFANNDLIGANPLQNFVYAPRWFIAYLGGMEIRALGPRRTPAWVYQGLAAASMLAVGLFRLQSARFSASMVLTVETTLWVLGAFLILQGAVSGAKWFGAEKLAWGRDYLIGIYVSHVLWLEIYAGAVHANNTLWGAPWIAGTWAFCMAASTLTVALLKSNRFTRPSVI